MSSEDTDYALGRTPTEYERLVDQARQLEPLTRRVFVAAGISMGICVLDVGCGVGDVSLLLRDLVGPTGSVVGVNLDADAIAMASARCETAQIGGIEFVIGDARSIEGAPFDAIAGRFVLMYTVDPTDTIRTLASLARPGGIVVFHEWLARPTAGLAAADQPALARLQQLLNSAFTASGAHVEIGAELFDRIRAAGLEPDPAPIAEFAVRLDDPEQVHRRWADIGYSGLPKMVEYGVIDQDDGEHLVAVQLREQLMSSRFAPLSPLMIGQWAWVQERLVSSQEPKELFD